MEVDTNTILDIVTLLICYKKYSNVSAGVGKFVLRGPTELKEPLIVSSQDVSLNFAK